MIDYMPNWPKEIRENQQLDQANKFKEEVEPKEGVEYDWVYDLAKLEFERRMSVFNDIDSKANDIIKYLGGGTAIVALGTLATIDKLNFWVLISVLPSFAAALLAVCYAAIVRNPCHFMQPSDGATVYEYAEQFKSTNAAKGAFAAVWFLCVKANSLVNNRKANFLATATWAYFASISLLSLPLVTAACVLCCR